MNRHSSGAVMGAWGNAPVFLEDLGRCPSHPASATADYCELSTSLPDLLAKPL